MRMVLRGQTLVQHAFGVGGVGVCVVPLHLSLRNCLPQTASLSVEAGLTVEASQRDGARSQRMSATGFALWLCYARKTQNIACHSPAS